MSAQFTVTVTTGDSTSPLSANKTKAVTGLRNYFHKLLGANQTGAHTVRTGLVAASAIVTAATVVNANTVTINGTALTATQKNARSTITAASAAAADTVTAAGVVFTAIVQRATATVTAATAIAGNVVIINGVTFTGTSGAVTPGAATFSIDTGNTETATSLAAQVNAHVVTAASITATSSSAVVTLRAVNAGVAGNALTLTSTGSTVAVTGSGFLAGGIAVANNQFDVSPGSTDTQVAADLARAINASVTTGIPGVITAQNAAAICTIRAVTAGTAGNAITLVSSNGSRLAASGSGVLANGAAASNNAFDFGGSDTQTAEALVAAVNASSTSLVSGHVIATNSGAAVTLTALAVGLPGNAITVAGTASTLVFTGSVTRLAGGTETSFTF